METIILSCPEFQTRVRIHQGRRKGDGDSTTGCAMLLVLIGSAISTNALFVQTTQGQREPNPLCI